MSTPFIDSKGKPPMPESSEPYAKRLKVSPSARRDKDAANVVDRAAEIAIAVWQSRNTNMMKIKVVSSML